MGSKGVPPASTRDQEGEGIKKGTTTTTTAAFNFVTMATVIAAIVCAFVGTGSEIESRRLFVVNGIDGMFCKGGDTTIKYR